MFHKRKTRYIKDNNRYTHYIRKLWKSIHIKYTFRLLGEHAYMHACMSKVYVNSVEDESLTLIEVTEALPASSFVASSMLSVLPLLALVVTVLCVPTPP